MKKNLLVSLADENYIDYAKQLFSSAYWKGGWDGDYMLLAYKVPEEKLKFFRDKGIIVKEIREFKANIDETSNFSETVLNKFLIFTEEFKKWDNILFLDVDIVIRYNINKLGKVNGFNAVSELFPLNPIRKPVKKEITQEDKKIFEEIIEKYGIGSVCKFNSGVMAFSTDIIKENTFGELTALSYKYHGTLNFSEQPILSIYFRDQFKNISRYYNYFVFENEHHRKIRKEHMNGSVIHFIAYNKPWLKESFFYPEWKDNYNGFEKINDFNILNHKVKKFSVWDKVKKNTIIYLNSFRISFDKVINKIRKTK